MSFNAQEAGARLKQERERLGLSQQQAANAVGIRREMWAKYEGGAEPGAKTLAGMSACGVDILYVLTGNRSFTPPDPIAPEHRALISDYDACSSKDREALRRTAAAMALGGGVGHAPTKVRKIDIFIEESSGPVAKKLKQRDTVISVGRKKK
ncbi:MULTISPECIES: helix-turn-helix domain-containing protein [Achromobacter]|uniref:Helix-turn-helix transcriptional regulator n=1 Tax=Achromobacter denitrificans TaxID=32002 RepID=A0A6N0JF87_ACHDE|nr:helix-turn-helix transcriptional regulator [Achromobacter denitrificans]QKQ45695.1 helix-turn-helix transcriptional regulator [Achromobacter denitrificans]